MPIDRTATAAMACLLACTAPVEPDCLLPSDTSPLPTELREASGATFTADGTLWVIADSGPAVLYAVSSADSIIARVQITGARNDDWEALASGPCGDGAECLFIGEIGDNLHDAAERAILRVRAPTPRQTRAAAERLAFRFPDGPRDAEALVRLPDGTILVISKGRNGPIGVYRFPATPQPGIVTLEHVQDLSAGIAQVPDQVTGAAASLDGSIIVVRTYTTLQRYALDRDTLRAAGPPVRLDAQGETQGEGIALDQAGLVVLVGEGERQGTIARLRCHLGPLSAGGTKGALF